MASVLPPHFLLVLNIFIQFVDILLSFGLIRSEKKLSVEPVFALAEEESERSAVESG